MSSNSSTQAYNEFTKVLIKIHVAMSTEHDNSKILACIIYLLFQSCFQKFYFAVEPERPIANVPLVPLVRPGWTIC